jgi:hypothetical protein
VAILGVVLTAVSASTRHRDLSDVAAVASVVGERLTSSEDLDPATPAHDDPTCSAGQATPATYTALAQAWAPAGVSGVTVTVDEVQFWNGTTFDGACHEAAGLRAQKLVVRVQKGAADERLEVVRWT